MVLTVRMEAGQWLWVEGCIGRFGDGWCKVRLIAQHVSRLRKVRLLRKRVRLCANVHRCAQMFVVACKVFPLQQWLAGEGRGLVVLVLRALSL